MTQRNSKPSLDISCCELLSNLYLCIGWHSYCFCISSTNRVVNCFQICIFVSDDTATTRRSTPRPPLWIAFKFVSLYRMTQLAGLPVLPRRGCELLSNLYLCIGWHSRRKIWLTLALLWIAFRFVSLYRMTQRNLCIKLRRTSCELLSNLYLCIGWHSSSPLMNNLISVVNCFQICIFVSDDTAYVQELAVPPGLWIAFKFVSLYRMTQPAPVT